MKENNHHSSFPRQDSAALLSKIVLPTILIVALIVALYLAKDSTYSDRVTPHSQLVETVVNYAVLACEAASIVVIVTSAVQGLFSYVTRLFNRDYLVQIRSSESIRLRMGHRLSLALEFAMAADILSLGISPRFNELLTLFVIILLRVLITIFLEYDIETSRYYHLLPESDWLNLDSDEETRNENPE